MVSSAANCLGNSKCLESGQPAFRPTTYLEKLDMTANFTDVPEVSGISVKIRELSGGKILCGKVALKLS